MSAHLIQPTDLRPLAERDARWCVGTWCRHGDQLEPEYFAVMPLRRCRTWWPWLLAAAVVITLAVAR